MGGSDILILRFWMGWRQDQVHSSTGQAVFVDLLELEGFTSDGEAELVTPKPYVPDSVE